MSIRDSWKFSYQSSVVAAAAGERARYHNDLVNDSQLKLDRAIDTLKTKGVQFQQYVGGGEIHAIYDPGFVDTVVACATELGYHIEQEICCDAYSRALRLGGEKLIELDLADIEYFGL